MAESVNIAECSGKIRENISRVIIGKEEVINQVLASLIAGGHVLIEDIPGTGKTKLAKALAASIDGDFNRIQFTPDLLPADITGLNIFNQQKGVFEFTKGPVFTNVLLADEINRATPRTQSGLLECMEEKQTTIDGETRKMANPFFIIATQNPIETAGTYPLPEAQIDRFMMQLAMGYPTVEEELLIMDRFMKNDPLSELQPVCSLDDILAMQDAIKDVYVHEAVRAYIANIVKRTREHKSLAMGINPRGTLALVRACQAYASINGRDYVTPDDVKALCVPVFAHRLLSYATDQTQSAKKILKQILTEIEVPTENWKEAK